MAIITSANQKPGLDHLPGVRAARMAGRRASFAVLTVGLLAVAAHGDQPPLPAPPGMRAFPIPPSAFRVLERDSGPRNYYRTIAEPAESFIRGVYGPSLETVTLFA